MDRGVADVNARTTMLEQQLRLNILPDCLAPMLPTWMICDHRPHFRLVQQYTRDRD